MNSDSRTAWHRLTRRRRQQTETPAPASITVKIELKDFATGVTQTFAIPPGSTVTTTLTGWIEGGGQPRVLKVPVTIRASAA